MKKYAFIYPGQGSQSLKMGADFIRDFHIAKEFVGRASEALEIDFIKLLNEDQENLNKTEYTQPAILLVSAIAQAIFQNESDIDPFVAFGHSLGEVSAFCLNGGANLEEAIILVHKRGLFMQQACRAKLEGKEAAMLVTLGGEEEAVLKISQDFAKKGKNVWCANFNTNNQTVLAGLKSDLEEISPILKENGVKKAMLLKMSVASHCPLLEDAMDPFKDLLESSLKDCNVDIISNATLDIYKSKKDAINNLTKQLIYPVLYHKSVQKAIDLGVTHFIELGNGNVLSSLNNKITDIKSISISDSESLKGLQNL